MSAKVFSHPTFRITWLLFDLLYARKHGEVWLPKLIHAGICLPQASQPNYSLLAKALCLRGTCFGAKCSGFKGILWTTICGL
jgi:hypothetical protein